MSTVVAPDRATKRTTRRRKRHCMSLEDYALAIELGIQGRSLCGKAWIWPRRDKPSVRSTADLSPNHCATCRKIVARLHREQVIRRALESLGQ